MSLLNQYYKNWLYVYPSPLNGRSYVQSKVGRSWYMRKDILVVASTFNCWILGFRVLFRVLQHISIVSLFHILKQAAWKKLQKKRKSSSSVSVIPIKASLRRCHHCGSHQNIVKTWTSFSGSFNFQMSNSWLSCCFSCFATYIDFGIVSHPQTGSMEKAAEEKEVQFKCQCGFH